MLSYALAQVTRCGDTAAENIEAEAPPLSRSHQQRRAGLPTRLRYAMVVVLHTAGQAMSSFFVG